MLPPPAPVYTHAHARTHARTHTYTHTHTHIYIYIFKYVHTHAHTHTHIHAHIHTHIYVYIYTYIYTYIHTHTYTHTHIHIYTHTYTRKWYLNMNTRYLHPPAPLSTHTHTHTHKRARNQGVCTATVFGSKMLISLVLLPPPQHFSIFDVANTFMIVFPVLPTPCHRSKSCACWTIPMWLSSLICTSRTTACILSCLWWRWGCGRPQGGDWSMPGRCQWRPQASRGPQRLLRLLLSAAFMYMVTHLMGMFSWMFLLVLRFSVLALLAVSM